MGPGAEARKSVVGEHLRFREDGGHYDQYPNRTTAQNTFREELQDSWLHLQSSRTDARLHGRKHAKCNPGLVEGCEGLQKQRRTVVGEMLENGGAPVQCILLWK